MATNAKEVQEGYEISGTPKTVTSYRTWLFSGGWPRFEGWPAKNVHTDLEFAKSCDLPSRAASGAMSVGYLTELMIDLFGEDWLAKGVLSLKFISIVDMGDKIISKARVTSKHGDDSGVRVDMDLWCENQLGDKVAVGTGWIKQKTGSG